MVLMLMAGSGQAMGRKTDQSSPTADHASPSVDQTAANSAATPPSVTGAGTTPAAGGIIPVGGPVTGNGAVTGAGNPKGIGNSGAGMSGAGMGTGTSDGVSTR